MISTKLNINQVEYIVRAKNKAELDKAVQFLYECQEHKMAQLEEGLNKAFDQLLTDIDEGKVVLTEPIADEEVMPEPPKPTTPPKPKAKPAAKKPTPKDTKTVNLGGMGKQG